MLFASYHKVPVSLSLYFSGSGWVRADIYDLMGGSYLNYNFLALSPAVS
jgi:hypothetical protein